MTESAAGQNVMAWLAWLAKLAWQWNQRAGPNASAARLTSARAKRPNTEAYDCEGGEFGREAQTASTEPKPQSPKPATYYDTKPRPPHSWV